jgi:multiple sugar transport system substrate-binding protein
MKENTMNRRDFLAMTACGLMAPAVLPRGAVAAEAGAKIDWQTYKGKTIHLLMSNHPWQEAIEPLLPEFESLTGIKVRANSLPEQQYLTKVVTDLSADAFNQDVFMTQFYEAPRFEQEKWTADLAPLMQNAALTDTAWYDWNDFFPAARTISEAGRLYRDRVAITAEAQVLIYRKDVLQGAGLPVPTTLDQVISAAKTISGKGTVAGVTMRGGPTNWWPLYGFVRSCGGDYLNAAAKPVINSPGSKQGLTAFAALAASAPPGITSYDWDEINTTMLSGQAAMFLDSSVIYSRLQDPKLSTVIGKIGVAPFPAGPAGRHGNSHYWSLSIAAKSRNKEAAWLFVEWATSKGVQFELAKRSIFPPRNSVAQMPELKTIFGDEFLTAVSTTLSGAVTPPANTKFNELMDPLRAAVQEVILASAQVGPALDGVEQQWNQILA